MVPGSYRLGKIHRSLVSFSNGELEHQKTLLLDDTGHEYHYICSLCPSLWHPWTYLLCNRRTKWLLYSFRTCEWTFVVVRRNIWLYEPDGIQSSSIPLHCCTEHGHHMWPAKITNEQVSRNRSIRLIPRCVAVLSYYFWSPSSQSFCLCPIPYFSLL